MSKMADVAAARREARRKRILENSHNRLQLISGKSGDESSTDSPIRTISPVPDDIPIPSISTSHSRTCLNNGDIVTEQETFEPLSSTLIHDNDIVAAGDGVVVNELAPTTSRTTEPVQTLLDKLTSYNYDIVLLSLILQIFYSIFSITERTYFFLPVIIYSVTKMVWFPSKSNSNIAHALMLLNSMSSSKIQKAIQVTQYIGVVSRDICIFLFTTICIQSLFVCLTDSLTT